MALDSKNKETEALKAKIESASPLEKANYVTVKLPDDSNTLRVAYVDMARQLSVMRAALEEIRTRMPVNNDLNYYFSNVIAYALGYSTEPPDPEKYDIDILSALQEVNAIASMPISQWDDFFGHIDDIISPLTFYNPSDIKAMAQDALDRQRISARHILLLLHDATQSGSYINMSAGLAIERLNETKRN